MTNNILSDQQQKNLNSFIEENNVDDNTDNIRIDKHSDLIRNDIKEYMQLKKKYERLSQTNPKQFDMMCNKNCSFLFNNYTNLYNKLIKNTLNLEIMDKFLVTLKKIETNEINQHEGSYIIGEYLKQIYIDSALIEDKQTQKYSKKIKKKPEHIAVKKISYNDYKQMNI